MKEPENSYEAAQLISKELSLPNDFIIKLPGEDDWAFVLKSHAIVEASVMHAFDARFPKCSIRKFLKDIRMAKRVDLAKQLEVISKEMIGPIRELSKIRNGQLLSSSSNCS